MGKAFSTRTAPSTRTRDHSQATHSILKSTLILLGPWSLCCFFTPSSLLSCMLFYCMNRFASIHCHVIRLLLCLMFVAAELCGPVQEILSLGVTQLRPDQGGLSMALASRAAPTDRHPAESSLLCNVFHIAIGTCFLRSVVGACRRGAPDGCHTDLISPSSISPEFYNSPRGRMFRAHHHLDVASKHSPCAFAPDDPRQTER